MKKLKYAFLFVLVICLVGASLIACNPPEKSVPSIPENPGGSVGEDYEVVKGQDAFGIIKNAAVNAGSASGDGYINSQAVLFLDYVNDAEGNAYAVKMQFALDLYSDAESELLLELWRTDGRGTSADNLTELLVGFYYFDSTIVYDCTGIKQGARAVKTDDLDLSALAEQMQGIFGDSGLADLIVNKLLGMDIAGIISVEDVLTALFDTSRLYNLGGGRQRLEIPFNIPSIISVVGGLLMPGVLIPQDIADLIEEVLGLDLAIFGTIAKDSLAVYLNADIADGKLSGIELGLGVDFNKTDEESGETETSPFRVKLGVSDIGTGERPDIDNAAYLAERGIAVDKLDEYSVLTLDMGLNLKVNLKQSSFTLGDLLDSFGTLFTGLLGDAALPAELLDKPINVGSGEYALAVTIKGGINMRDAAETNFVVDIKGTDGTLRARAAYIGADKAVYADLSGILGTGKFKVENIDVNSMLAGLVDQLVQLVRDGIESLDDSVPEGAEGIAQYEAVLGALDEGRIVQAYAADDNGAPIQDTMGLVMAIFDTIEVDMDGNIFNINGINAALTEEILNYLWGIIFTEPVFDESGAPVFNEDGTQATQPSGGRIPVIGDVNISYVNEGFALPKTITIGEIVLGAGAEGTQPWAGITLGLSARFGSVDDEGAFNGIINDIRTDADAYLPIDISDGFTVDALLAGIQSVGFGISLGLDVKGNGELADITYDNLNDYLLNIGVALDNLDAALTLEIKGELTDLQSVINGGGITELLGGANVYIAVKNAENGTAALEIWLMKGVLYLRTSLIGGAEGTAVKADIAELIAAAGTDAPEGEGASSEATGGAIDPMALIAALIGGVNIAGEGGSLVNVYLASGLLATIMELMGVEGLEISLGGDGTGDITGGVSIELPAGLDLTELGLSIDLGIGDALGLGISLGGFNAVINDGEYVPLPDEDAYTDVLENPYVYIGMDAGIDATLYEGSISLGEGFGDIVIGEGNLKAQYVLNIRASLDLSPLVAYAFGDAVVSAGNRTQLAVELLKKTADGGTKTMLAVYYDKGVLYLDAAALGIDRLAVNIDIVDLIINLINNNGSGGSGDGGTAALTAAEESGGSLKTVIAMLAAVSSEGVIIELTQGLTEILLDLTGIDAAEIDALLGLDWTQIGAPDEDGKLLDVTVTVKDDDGADGTLQNKAEFGVYISGLEIAFGEREILPEGTVTGGGENEYDDLGELITIAPDGAFGLHLEQIFVEAEGTLSLGADSTGGGTEDWTLGEWIAAFIGDSTTNPDGSVTDNTRIKALLQRILVKFGVDADVTASVDFALSAMLRFNPDDMADIGYLLSHSDIGLTIEAKDKNAATVVRIALYVLSGSDGRSTLYIDADGALFDEVKMSVPGLDLGALFAAEATEGGGETAADGTAGEGTSILDTIKDIFNNAIYGITADGEHASVNLHANFVAWLLGLLLDGVQIPTENFIPLNPDNSYLQLWYADSYKLALGLGVDPVRLELSLGGLHVSFDGNNGVTPEGFNPADYPNVLDGLDNLSAEMAVDFELSLKNTGALEDGELKIGDILAALGVELALKFGIAIPDDLVLKLTAFIGVNIDFADPDRTEIALEVRNAYSPDSGTVFGAYLRGGTIWVDGGLLTDKDFMIEDSAFGELLTETLQGLLSGASESADEAATAAADPAQSTDGTEYLDVMFEIAEGHMSLVLTENVIMALIATIAGGSTDIDGILDSIEALNLGLKAEAGIDFTNFSINVDVTSNYADLGISVVAPKASIAVNDNVSARIDAATADKEFRKYEDNKKVRFGIDIDVSYNAEATYKLFADLTEEEQGKVSKKDRYTLVDGSYVQSDTGEYVRYALGLSEILDAVLGLDVIEDGVASMPEGLGRELVAALIASLGVEAYVNDPMNDNLRVSIAGLLDLEKLGFDGILGGNFADLPSFGADEILDALEISIGILFNPESTADKTVQDITLYLIEGRIYADASGIGGPKVQLDFMDLLDRLGALSGGESANAAPAEGGADEGASAPAADDILNAIIRKIIIGKSAMDSVAQGKASDILGGIGVGIMFNSRLLADLLGMFLPDYEFDLGEFNLGENSGIFLDVSGGGISLDVRAELAAGFEMSLDTESGLDINFFPEDQTTMLNKYDRTAFVDVTQYVYNICKAAGAAGFDDIDADGFGEQRIDFSLSGMLYFNSEYEDSYDFAELINNLLVHNSLLDKAIADLFVQMRTQSAFKDGVAFRLSAAMDIAAMDFAALSDAENGFADFLANSDLSTLELALELLQTDADGNIVYESGAPVVTAGVYLYNGNLYIDGTELFTVAESYAYIPNFTKLITEAVGNTGTGAAAPETADAASDGSAPSLDEQRDAVLSLVYSNTSMQIALTKSLLTMILATLMPDLGALGDIFGAFEVSLGVDIGSHAYKELPADPDAEGISENNRFAYYGEAKYDEDANGDYLAVLRSGEKVYLPAEGYVFYKYDETEGGYIPVADGSGTHVRYQGEYLEIEGRYIKKSGYVHDPNGNYYRVQNLYKDIDEFWLGFDAKLGALNLGLKAGGLDIGFGSSDKLIPQYILDGKSHDGTEDVPLLPFYDTLITVGMSLEFELSITEGVIDIGAMLQEVGIAALDGVTLEMPGTAKGYSSAHFRLDVSLMLDMFEIGNSEIALSIVNIAETGAEVEWIGVYYMRDMLYLDLSFFGLPKLAVPVTVISEYLDELLGDLLDGTIYDEVEVPGSAEAVTADSDGSGDVDDTSVDMNIEDKIAQLLIGNRNLTVTVSNALIRYLLTWIKIGDNTLEDLIYDDLLGSLSVEFNLGDGVSLEADAYLALLGDRYVPVASDEAAQNPDGERYFVFAENKDGRYALGDDGEYYLSSGTDENAGTRYERREVAFAEGSPVYYAYTALDGEPVEGTQYYVYDAENDEYLPVAADYEGDVQRYFRTETSVEGGTVYMLVPAPDTNPNRYDMELNLSLDVKNLDVYFTSQHEYTLTGEELAEYRDINAVDNVTLSETISLDMLFKEGSPIDLTPLLEYLFGDSVSDITYSELQAIINASSDFGGDVERRIDLVVSVEFRLGAFMNYMRQLAADDPTVTVDIPDEFDLVSFIQVLDAVIKSDVLGLEAMLDFVNAAVEVVTYGDAEQTSEPHTMLGLYLVGGDFVKIGAGENVPAAERYSHYFKSDKGGYRYDDVSRSFVEIADGEEYDGQRYAFDGASYYPNVYGDMRRDGGGLYLDLSYLGQPGLFVTLARLQQFIADIMDEISGGEAVTADETADGGASGGLELGGIELPLISGQIAGYVKMFLYGIRMTSTYIQVLAQADYLNSLIALLVGEENVLEFGDQIEKPYIQINTDFNNYVYAYAAEATAEQLAFADTRFRITKNVNGLYWIDGGLFRLRAEMTESEKESYKGEYYDIVGMDLWLDVDGTKVALSDANRTDKYRAARYTSADIGKNGVTEAMVGTFRYYEYANGEYSELDYSIDRANVENNVFAVYASADRKPFVTARIFLWEYEINLDINLPDTAVSIYEYGTASEEDATGRYDKTDKFIYVPDENISADGGSYIYYRGGYYEINAQNLYKYEGGEYVRLTEEEYEEFLIKPYDVRRYLFVDTEEFSLYVPVVRNNVYGKDVYGEKYTPSPDGEYVRETGAGAISKPDMHVDYNEAIDNYDALDGTLYLDPVTDRFISGDEARDKGYDLGELKTAERDDVVFVRDDATNKFVSVNEYKSIYGDAADEKLPSMKKYASSAIDYVDLGKLYYAGMTIRGSIFMNAYSEYLTADEWNERYPAEALPAEKYSFVGGEYVRDDAKGTYYRRAADALRISEVLGGLLGDLGASLFVGESYKAEILFEIKANVAIGYTGETYGSVYIAELQLAVDAWRRETSGELNHILGVYYDSDEETGKAALYADLTALLGEGAKFKVDLSAYTVEELLNGVLQDAFAGSGAEASTAAETFSATAPDSATILLNIYTRRIALQVSASFIKLLIAQFAPNIGPQLEELMPNIVLNAKVDLAPYDITIGATLYDNTGENGLLDLGLTLNLFNTEDRTQGTQLDFGSLEEFQTMSAQRLAAMSEEYIFYYGMFTRVDDGAEGDDIYVRDGDGKGYVKADADDLADKSKPKYRLNDEIAYELIERGAVESERIDKNMRYAYIPAGFEEVLTKADYDNYKSAGTSMYYAWYNYDTPTEYADMRPYSEDTYRHQTIVFGKDETGGKVYVRKEGAAAFYAKDANGTYKQSRVFNDYKNLLSIDLRQLVNAEEYGAFDILAALAESGPETVEIDFSAGLSLSLSNLINFTHQITRFLYPSGDGGYFRVMLAAVTENFADLTAMLGGTVDVKLRVNVGNLIEGISADGGVDMERMFAGAQAYVSVKLSDGKDKAYDPIELWLEFDENALASLYIDGAALGELLGLSDAEYGVFLDKLMLEDLDIFGLIASASAPEMQSAEAGTAAPEEYALGDKDTGILPENVWDIVNMLLGQIIIADDIVSVGLAEAVLANLVEYLAPGFGASEYLPKVIVSGDYVTGINILFEGAPAIEVNIGLTSGMDFVEDYETVLANGDPSVDDEAVVNDGKYINKHIYGEDIAPYLEGARVNGADGEYTVDAKGGKVLLSDDEYVLAAFASSEFVWTGTRYNMEAGENGAPVFTRSEAPYANAFVQSADGVYGDKPEGFPAAYVGGDVGGKLLVAAIENAMRTLGGDEDYVYKGTRYSLDPTKIDGDYISVGDFRADISLGGLGIKVDEEFGAPDRGEGYTDVKRAQLRLHTELDVSLYGNPDAENGEVDLGGLLDMIFEQVMPGLSGSDLFINVDGALGSKDSPYWRAFLDAYISLEDFSLQLALEVKEFDKESGALGEANVLALYLNDDNVYVDLSGLLGPTAKIAVTNLGVSALLSNALGGLLGANNSANGATGGEALPASIEDTVGMTMHEYAYLAVFINPTYFSVQLTTMAINAIIDRIGAENPDAGLDIEIPDLGEIMLKFYTDASEGRKLSFNAKFTEGFMASLDVASLALGTEPLNFDEAAGEDYIKLDDYAEVYDVATGDLNDVTINLSASLSLQIDSSGMTSADENYADSFAGWVVGLIQGLLEGQSMFGRFILLASADEARAHFNAGGSVYIKGADGYVRIENEEDIQANGTSYYKFEAAELDLTLPQNAITLIIDIAADVHLGPIIKYGIGGIAYSDLQVEISTNFGDTTSDLISIYYLGSSRLEKKGGNNFYTLTTNGTVFSDAIYIDATGLGLGGIKFQGISGLLGANVGEMFDDAATAAETDGAAEENAAGSSGTGGMQLEIRLSDSGIGLCIDKNMIEGLLALLNVALPIELPDLQKINIELQLGDSGLAAINIYGGLDGVGTNVALGIDVNEIALNKEGGLVDVENLVGKFSVGYAGLTYSKTAGVMTLLQNIIESIDPSIEINMEKRVKQVVNSVSANYISYVYPRNDLTKAKLTLERSDTSSTNVANAYRLKINLDVTHPYTPAANHNLRGEVYLSSNTLLIPTDTDKLTFLDGLGGISGLVDRLLPSIMNPIAVDLSSVLGGLAYSDADTEEWEYPTASTAADEAASSADASSAEDSGLSLDILDGLVEKVSLNLFNSNGYLPYLPTMTSAPDTNAADDARYISVKLELGKDAYNELIIMLHLMLLQMVQETAEQVSTRFFPKYYDNPNQAYGSNDEDGYMAAKDRGIVGFRSDDRDFMGNKSLGDMINRLNAAATTEERVNIIKDYSVSIPYNLLRWVIDSGLIGDVNLAQVLNLGAWGVMGNLSTLIGTLLPLPYASYDEAAPNPSLNIYIDLAPQASTYGFTDGRTIAPGIQAIEIMVNGEKTGAGTQMSWYNGAGGTTPDQAQSSETMVLTINPRNLRSGDKTYDDVPMLGFLEGDSATIIGSTPVPTEIVIDDPARRTGTVYTGGSSKGITLNGSASGGLADASLFPQKANVIFADGHSSVGGSGNNAMTGTTIIWDASTVDLTAAAIDAEGGRRLAGYVYGYALNIVVAAIPVYVTNNYAVSTIQSYTGNDSDGYRAGDIRIDIAGGRASLPDLVRVSFHSASPSILGRQLRDAQGNALKAIMYKDGARQTLGTTIDAANVVSDILNEDGNNFKLIAAYAAGATEVSAGAADSVLASDGKYYATETVSYNGVSYTYVKLDFSKLPNGANFPAGTFDWDDADFKYGWSGGSVTVDYTYQWGLSATAYGSMNVPVVNYEIDAISRISGDGGNLGSLQGVSFDGKKLTVNALALGSLLGDGENLATWLAGFDRANISYSSGSGGSNLALEWDTDAILAALGGIERGSGYDYYKGLTFDVTVWIGGDSTYKLYRLTNANGAVTSGMTGDGKVNGEYIAQPYTIKVEVTSGAFASVQGGSLSYDPYSALKIDGAALAPDGSYINAVYAGGMTGRLEVGKDVFVDAPYTASGSSYVKAEGSALDDLMKQISYRGYTGGRTIYAQLTIGSDKTGVQTVYVPVSVVGATARTTDVTIPEGTDIFNPEWYNEGFGVIKGVQFRESGVSARDMQPDWSTVEYYSNSACTNRLDNIFGGGTVYARVQANVVIDGQPAGNGSLAPQTITLRLSVPVVNNPKLSFWNGTGGADDIANYTASAPYGLKDGYSLSPYAYLASPDEFFTSGEYGEAMKVRLTYNGSQGEVSYFTYVTAWDVTDLADLGRAGGEFTVTATVGNVGIPVRLKVPASDVTYFTVTDGGTVSFESDGNGSAVSDGKVAQELVYDVTDEWRLPVNATLDFGDVYSADDVQGAIVWDNAAAPAYEELQRDESGYYVDRTFRFLGGTALASEAVTARIRVENVVSDENATFDFAQELVSEYPLFGDWSLPVKADLHYGDGGVLSDVNVHWDGGAPDAGEIEAGRFVRTATAALFSKEYEFTVANNYTFVFGSDGLDTASYAPAVGHEHMHYSIDNAAKFFRGMPVSGSVRNNETGAEFENAAFDWNGFTYAPENKDALTAVVTVSANGKTHDFIVHVIMTNAADFKIVDVDGKPAEWIADPFGKTAGSADNMFAQGEKLTARLAGGAAYAVNARYELPEDFYTHAAKYFGRVFSFDIVFEYGGMSQRLAAQGRAVDRTVTDITLDDSFDCIENGVVTIDPFRFDTFAAAVEAGALPAEIEAVAGGETFSFLVDWGSDDVVGDKGYHNSAYGITLTYVGADGVHYASQTVNTVLDVKERIVVSAGFVMGGENYVLLTERNNNVFGKTYRYINGETGQIVEINYNPDTMMPEEIIFFNAYAFVDNIPATLRIMFANGEIGDFFVKIKDAEGNTVVLPSADNPAPSSTVVLEVWNGSDMKFVVDEISVTLSFRKTSVTAHNTDISSDDLYNLKYRFGVYGGEHKDGAALVTPFEGKYDDTFTFYVDGRFVTKQMWEETYRDFVAADGTENVYKALGDDGGKTYYYRYDRREREYVLLDGESDDTSYVFVYTTVQTMTVDEWNLSSVSYGADGGTSYATAHVTAGNGLSFVLEVPVWIEDASAETVKFSESDFELGEGMSAADGKVYFDASRKNYFDITEQTFTFDPFSGINPFETDNVGGKAVYRYFPRTMSFTTVSGYTVDGYAADWNLANFSLSWRGGTFTVSALIAASVYEGDGFTHTVPAQTIAKDMVKVVDKRATGLAAENSSLTSVVGYTDGEAANSFIDPYNFDLRRDMTDKLPDYINVLIGGETVTFSVGNASHKLAWDTSSLNVNYNGGKTWLTARLTGPDGVVQEMRIGFLVTRVLVDTMTADDKTFTFNGGNTASTAHELKIYDPSTHTLPTEYDVRFIRYKPDADGTFTKEGVADVQATHYDYVSVTMPSAFAMTVENAKVTRNNIGVASMQIAGGQRLSVTVNAAGVEFSSADVASDVQVSGNILPGHIYAKGVRVSVVWYGTAEVNYGGGTAKWTVTFATGSDGNIIIGKIPNRTVTYRLRPYIGAVVDSVGRALDKDETGVPRAQVIGNEQTVHV